MIALDARPFVGITVDGDVAHDNVVFRGARRRRHECGMSFVFFIFPAVVLTLSHPAASECKLIAKDFWSRNFDRWVVGVSVVGG